MTEQAQNANFTEVQTFPGKFRRKPKMFANKKRLGSITLGKDHQPTPALGRNPWKIFSAMGPYECPGMCPELATSLSRANLRCLDIGRNQELPRNKTQHLEAKWGISRDFQCNSFAEGQRHINQMSCGQKWPVGAVPPRLARVYVGQFACVLSRK